YPAAGEPGLRNLPESCHLGGAATARRCRCSLPHIRRENRSDSQKPTSVRERQRAPAAAPSPSKRAEIQAAASAFDGRFSSERFLGLLTPQLFSVPRPECHVVFVPQ